MGDKNIDSNIDTNIDNYSVYADKSVINNNDNHHISHCENLEHFSNVKIIKCENCILKNFKENIIAQWFLFFVTFKPHYLIMHMN